MSSEEIVVAARSLRKSYGDVVAVNRVSVEVKAGEIYSLLGANGAGKSTFFRMITGLSLPDDGQISICGQDMLKRSVPAKRHLGYLPEDLYFYQRLTGREYLKFVAGLKGSSHDPACEIDFFELSSFQHKQVGGYSLGMRKKLGLAAAFVGHPRVLILDEPLNGLDVEMMKKLRLRLEEVKKESRTVLISSHVMSFVERVSTRIGILKFGSLVAEGTPTELRKLTEMSTGDFEDVFFRLAK